MPSTKIRPLEENDFSELADLLREGLRTPPEIWQRRFDMWWINNPWMDRSIPYGWVIEDEKSEIVGFLGNIPVKYQIKGINDIAAAGTSLYVRPSVRGVTSLQLILAFDRQKNIKLLLHTTPNKIATKIYSKFGSSDLDVPFKNLEYWYIRDYGKMCDFYVQKNITSHRLLPLIEASLVPIKLISPFVRWFKDKRTFKLQPDHYKCSLCTDCDDSFTELWENNRKENATTLCRDAETLKWLYFSKAVAEKRHLIKCIDTRNDELVGYFVFDIECSETDIKTMQLKDAYVPQLEEEIILSLIAFSIDLAKRHNAAALAFWPIDQKMNEILKKRIKIKRKHKRAYMYKFVNEDDESNLEGHEDHEFIPSSIDPDRGVL
ncbi:hypothetical protein [Methanococcoides sp. NM1]|uniref:hypothetical protein n=1 Tax=Methanococcoides sp. NM1 TaxID=1201013 RepID=UPI001083BFE5|nr:hypothetical protein [Methanococcoides sp. NM1]